MIILQDQNAPVGKILLPMRRHEWDQPSQRLSHHDNRNKTRFLLTGRLHDGHIVWRGWFDDRDDADAFLLAMASGTLNYEHPLWELPSPAWHPWIGEDLQYQFSTIAVVTTSAGTAQNWVAPSDFSTSNRVGILGGGANGGLQIGGGGAAWAQSNNVALAAGSSNKLFVPSAGQDGWLRIDGGTTAPTTTAQGILGKGTSAQAGALASACLGTAATFSGGSGSSYDSPNQSAGSGGGAAGPNGAGSNAAATATGFHTGIVSGGGDNGFGGAATATGNGNSGTELDGVSGCGAGGVGGINVANSNAVGTTAGNYGSGGGGQGNGSFAVGPGTQGLAYFIYGPVLVYQNFFQQFCAQ